MRYASCLLGACVGAAGAVVIAGEVPTEDIIGFQAGDTLTASDLNDNFEALRSAVTETDQSMPRVVGTQVNKFTDPVPIETENWIQIEELTINIDHGPVDISFDGHVVVEGENIDGTDRYEFGICKGSASAGDVVGTGWWRPSSTDQQYQASTIAFTGFDANVDSGVTYSLCARKLNSVDADLVAYVRGLTATIAPR